MAKKTIKAQMKQRRDTKANWAATNPVLLDGELGIVSDDPNLYKVGDGATAWNSLPFRGFDGTLAQELGTSENAVISQKVVSEKLTELESKLGTYIESPEFIRVYTDNKGNILWGIKPDGTIHFGTGVPPQIVDFVTKKIDEPNLQNYAQIELFLTDYINSAKSLKEILEGKIDGEYINDIEGKICLETDATGKILSYRDSKGVKHERAGIETTAIKVTTLEVDNIQSKHYVGIGKDFSHAAEDDVVYCEKPKYAELWLEGVLPTDKSDARTPTNLGMTLKIGNVTQLIGRCNLSIQGHGSTAYDKKGYTFEPVNANGESVKIKFGEMVETDSFHLKAYATDMLHCRDLGGYAIWHDMIKLLEYPSCKFNNIPFELPTEYSKDKNSISDAYYVPLGFQVGVYLNGEFHGLYTLKHKKTRQNYAMDKNVKSQIFLDSINYKSWLKEGFDHTAWDLKNPKIKGYEEGDEITDAEVKANIDRLFNYLYQINPNDSATYSNYADYLVLPHWIAFLIMIELIHGIDQVGNNINLMTWDATRWSIVPWDLDLSCGLVGGSKIIRSDESYYRKFSLQTTNTNIPNEMKWWPDFKTIFATEIKDTWTMLRKSGFITEANIAEYFKREIDGIPRSVYEADYEKWGCIWTNGIPTFEQLLLAIHYKIKWLDTQWLNQYV